MVLLGAGMGMVIQVLVLAVQNEAPAEDLGVATSTVTFFRTVGGSVGVALFGALFSSRLGHLLGGAAPEGLTPETIGQLPEAQRAQMAGAFADSITMVFRYAVPLLLVGFALTWLLKNMPLRATSASAERDFTPLPAAGGTDAVPAGAPAGAAAAAAPADWGRDDAPMRVRDPVVVMD
jgi:hypothetical protein